MMQIDRKENILVEEEIFTATGVLAEQFIFTGSKAYYPNGILEVSYKDKKNKWVAFPPTKYAIQAGGQSIKFVPGFSVIIGTLVRVAYLSPEAS